MKFHKSFDQILDFFEHVFVWNYFLLLELVNMFDQLHCSKICNLLILCVQSVPDFLNLKTPAELHLKYCLLKSSATCICQ